MRALNRLFIAMATLLLAASINAETNIDFSKTQKVYFAPKPLPLIAKDLKKKYNWSDRRILKHLKETLPKITPKLAREKFNIDWIDNNISENTKRYFFQETRKKTKPKSMFIKGYPVVAICYMGPEVGYGLFTMSDIPKFTIIAEYTGKKVNEKNFKSNAYTADLSEDESSGKFEKIDALYWGNAARFAQHIVDKNDLSTYEYTMDGISMAHNNNIEIPNSGLHAFEDHDGKKILFLTIQDIKIFEQIGYKYSKDAGYNYLTSQLKVEPHLFYKNGSIIPKNRYQTKRKGVLFDCVYTNKKFKTSPVPIVSYFDYLDILKRSKITSKLESFNDKENYMVLTDENNKVRTIINNKVFVEKITHAKRNDDVGRVTIPSYIVHMNTNTRKFIIILKKTNKAKISKKNTTKILNAARNNQFKKAIKLLKIAKSSNKLIEEGSCVIFGPNRP